MAKYVVISEFEDLQNDCRRKVGDVLELDDERAASLKKIGVVIPDAPDSDGLTSLGGGYYLLPNGDKVRGKDKALEALKALQELKQAEGGDANGAPDSNPATS